MNLTKNNFCEDWGWYIDTENYLLTNPNINIMVYNSDKIYKNTYYSKLCKIEENEYYYSKNNYKDNENLELDYNYNEIQKEFYEKNETINLNNISSITLMTCILVYFIFFIL